MAKEDEFEIPDFGAVFTFGKSRFADNVPSHFFIRNDPIIEISCGDEHTAVVCQKGRVFVFGSNNWGQLGLGHKDTINKPSCVKSLKCEQVQHVSCGRAHSIFSTGTNKLLACGSNNEGQLGVEPTNGMDHSVVPVLIMEFDENIALLTAGSQHSAVLLESGKVFMWGSNSEGQCGLGQSPSIITTPTLLVFKDSIISHLSCGYYHTAFVTSEGKLLVCGEGENGKLGLGDDIVNQVYPMPVVIDAFITYIACGGSHTIALSDESKVYVFGKNQNEELGLQDLQTVMKPSLLNFVHDKKVKKVSCGERHTGFVTEDGELWMCGDNRHGELCLEWIGDKSSPISRVSIFSSFFVKDVVCGGCHTMVFASPQASESENPESDLILESSYKPSKQDGPKMHPLPPLQRLPQNMVDEEKNSVLDHKVDDKSETGIFIPLVAVDVCNENGKEVDENHKDQNGSRNGTDSFPLKTPQKGNWCSNDTGIEIDEDNLVSIDTIVKAEPMKDAEELNEESVSRKDKKFAAVDTSVVTKKSGLFRFFNHLRNKKTLETQSENIVTAKVIELENVGKQRQRKRIDESRFRENKTKSKACVIL